jgi:hypothetical protein
MKIAILLLVTVVLAACAELDKTERVQLAGIDTANVVVEYLSATVESTGMSTDQVTDSVTSLLQQAGLVVTDSAGYPCAYVRASVVRSRKQPKTCAFMVEVDLRQGAWLCRAPRVFTVGRSWEWGRIGVCDYGEVKSVVETEITSGVQELVFALQSANEQ